MGFAVYKILFLYVVFSNKCIFLGGVYGSAQYVNLEIYENKTNHFKVFLSAAAYAEHPTPTNRLLHIYSACRCSSRPGLDVLVPGIRRPVSRR